MKKNSFFFFNTKICKFDPLGFVALVFKMCKRNAGIIIVTHLHCIGMVFCVEHKTTTKTVRL